VSTVVLRCGDAPVPIPLTTADVEVTAAPPVPGEETVDELLPVLDVDGLPRLIVLGDDTGLAAVLTRLLRIERLDVPVGYVPLDRTEASRRYKTGTGAVAARRALLGTPQETPLIRDDAGAVLVGRATITGEGGEKFEGEAYVDETLLFRGRALRIHVTANLGMPGLSARAQLGRYRTRHWIEGRALQVGTPGALVSYHGATTDSPRKRVVFYRHHLPWLLPH
jgi:hypothetical protein